MIYSYTQLSQYQACPRRYRYRYVDRWQEKDSHAGLPFGRAFEVALAAYFQRQDATQVLFQEWSKCQSTPLDYKQGDSWERMFHQGIKLLELFAQHDRVEIRYPNRNLQVKISKALSASRQFVGYIDALGYVDGRRCVIDWKTTAVRYPDHPETLLSLDPQLACYSWLTGEPEVAFVVFVRKRLPEIQYLHSTISDERRREFGQVVTDTIAQIEAAQFLPRPGIRFPQNGCTSCSYIGLCLADQRLIDGKLLQRPGGDVGLFDELDY
jgi:hypothetical protein